MSSFSLASLRSYVGGRGVATFLLVGDSGELANTAGKGAGFALHAASDGNAARHDDAAIYLAAHRSAEQAAATIVQGANVLYLEPDGKGGHGVVTAVVTAVHHHDLGMPDCTIQLDDGQFSFNSNQALPAAGTTLLYDADKGTERAAQRQVMQPFEDEKKSLEQKLQMQQTLEEFDRRNRQAAQQQKRQPFEWFFQNVLGLCCTHCGSRSEVDISTRMYEPRAGTAHAAQAGQTR